MKNLNLELSFNNFKNSIMSNQKLTYVSDEAVDQLMERTRNKAIDDCINYVESQRVIYDAIYPDGITSTVLESISKTLAHFKKPIP